MTSILLTGFEPFCESTTNPSWQALERAAARWPGPETLHIAELPVVFGECAEAIHTLIRHHRPDLVIAVGQAGGRAQITPERIAINVDDARIPDNAGAQPIDVPIVVDGPAAYFSTLPIKAAVEAMRQRDIPAAVSNSAGTYVCNHIFYAIMHEFACDFPATRGGFVHVPFTPDQVADANTAQPSLSLDLITEGLLTIIRTSLDTPGDLAISGGTEH
ncbi:MAG: pyroglutamyl-peptidase I [Thermomicrobiales bacterium]